MIKSIIFGILTSTLGFMTMCYAFIYGGFNVGVPYQDAPKHLQEEWELKNDFVDNLFLFGLIIFLLGIVLPIIKLLYIEINSRIHNRKISKLSLKNSKSNES